MNTEMKAVQASPVKAVANPVQLDKNCIPSAEAIIKEYTAKGVLLEQKRKNGEMHELSLQDDVFLGTNELAKCKLDFKAISKNDFERNWAAIFGLFEDFLLGIKCGVICLLGMAILPSLRSLILDFAGFVALSPEKADRYCFRKPTLFLDIFVRLPVLSGKEEERDEIAFRIGLDRKDHKGERRALPDFKSIFLFNSVLSRYWASEGAKKEVFAPVFFWWRISTVASLRPIEFLVTPWECLEQRGNEWYLTLRRSRLKGKSPSVGYSIKDDFIEVRYCIPEDLAQEIQDYKERASQYQANALGTLLSPRLRYESQGLSWDSRIRYYTYASFVKDLHLFYDEVMAQYGYNTVQEDGPWSLKDATVRFIHPGDARHLAAINLVESGTPLHLVQLIMHHATTDQTAHYAGNTETYEETAVKKSHREEAGAHFKVAFDFSGYEVQIPKDASFVQLDEGRCYSPAFAQNSAEHCVKSAGPGGRAGWCARCGYFRSDLPNLAFMDSGRYIEEAGEHWRRLLDTVEHYRKDYAGMEETLAKVLMDAKSSLNILKNLLERNVEKRMEEGAQKEEAQDGEG